MWVVWSPRGSRGSQVQTRLSPEQTQCLLNMGLDLLGKNQVGNNNQRDKLLRIVDRVRRTSNHTDRPGICALCHPHRSDPRGITLERFFRVLQQCHQLCNEHRHDWNHEIQTTVLFGWQDNNRWHCHKRNARYHCSSNQQDNRNSRVFEPLFHPCSDLVLLY